MKIPLTPTEVSTYYRHRQPRLQQRGDEWRSRCPIHDGKNPNFVVRAQSGDWYCFSKCGRGGPVVDLEMALSGANFPGAVKEVERLVGRPEKIKAKIVATYDYCDKDATLIYQVLRKEPKSFIQRRPDEKGGWIWSTKGVRRVLYRLPRLKDADLMIVVEGETDVDNLYLQRRRSRQMAPRVRQ